MTLLTLIYVLLVALAAVSGYLWGVRLSRPRRRRHADAASVVAVPQPHPNVTVAVDLLDRFGVQRYEINTHTWPVPCPDLVSYAGLVYARDAAVSTPDRLVYRERDVASVPPALQEEVPYDV